MGRKVVALGFLLSLAGCGTQADPRLIVTDRLRVACQLGDRYYTDEQITAFITLAEQDRVNGYTYADGIGIVGPGCQSQHDTEDEQSLCSSCAVAVLNQVYGL